MSRVLSERSANANRAVPLRDYRLGLLMPEERQSVKPIAAAPARVVAQHQALLYFVGNTSWSDYRLLAKVRDLVLPPNEPMPLH